MNHLTFNNKDSLEEFGAIHRYGRKWLVSEPHLYQWLRRFGKNAGRVKTHDRMDEEFFYQSWKSWNSQNQIGSLSSLCPKLLLKIKDLAKLIFLSWCLFILLWTAKQGCVSPQWGPSAIGQKCRRITLANGSMNSLNTVMSTLLKKEAVEMRIPTFLKI